MRHAPRPLAQAVQLAMGLAFAAPLAAQDQVVDLSQVGTTHPGFRIDGVNAGDISGVSVSGAGDVNGDGLADLIVGASRVDGIGYFYTTLRDVGFSYVVFGRTDTTPVDLGNLGEAGFQIEGINTDDRSGFSVSGAGDVNGDGLDDLIVGARDADPAGGSGAGESYVVFGKADGGTVRLSSLESTGKGFQINGIGTGDRSGESVSGAGDVNGDGLDDLVIGASGGDRYVSYFVTNSGAGESYVVFGKSDSAPVDLDDLGSGGFLIVGDATADRSGFSVSGAGDVNGDGLNDLIIGARDADPGNESRAGKSYVVFGKSDNAEVQLADDMGSAGFRIDGINASDQSGESVSGAGDVNGDGLADLIIGASGYGFFYCSYTTGFAYVVFGKADGDPVDLDNLAASDGFVINGIDVGDDLGESVAGTGDFNGDGFADLIVGARCASPGSGNYAGESHIVFGKADGDPVDLASLGSAGIRLEGVDASDNSGTAVSSAGDVDGDGLSDVIIGATGADPGGDSGAGESYVVFSTESPPVSSVYRARAGPGNAPELAVGVVGDGSTAASPASRAWIDYADGTGVSTETVTLNRNRTGLTTNLANVAASSYWRLQSDRVGVSQPIQVSFRYTDAEIDGLTESDLTLYRGDAIGGPYEQLGVTPDLDRNLISASVDALGFFIVAEVTGEIDLQQPLGAETSVPNGGTRAIGDVTPIGDNVLPFTVVNLGTVPLTGVAVSVTGCDGANNLEFCMIEPIGAPGSPIETSGEFEVRFDVLGNGPFEFGVEVTSSDADEDPYQITVTGNGAGGDPEMGLERDSSEILDGATDDLGFVPPIAQTQSYAITSSGTVSLSVSEPVLGNAVNVENLAVSVPPNSPVSSGTQTQFEVTFDPIDVGAFSFDLSIGNNDADENPYDVTVSGIVPDVLLTSELALSEVLVDNDDDGLPNPSDTVRFEVDLLNSGQIAAGETSFDFVAPAGTTITRVGKLDRPAFGDSISSPDGTFITGTFNDLGGSGSLFPGLVSFDLLIDNEIAAEAIQLQGAFTYFSETSLTDDRDTPAVSDPTSVPLGSLSRLQPGDTSMDFGQATAVSNRFVAVGAPGDDSGAGAVSIYEIDANGRRQFIQRLTPPAGFDGAGFGMAVSLDDDILVVGSADSATATKGTAGSKVAIFQLFNTSQPDLIAQITGNLADGFGTTVELDGDTLIVGAPEEDHSGTTDAGAVYMYSLENLVQGDDQPVMRVTDSSPQTQARFGGALACANGKVAIGAPGPINAALQGRAAILDVISGALTTLDPPFDGAGEFGAAVSIDNGRIFIGSPLAGAGAGGVFEYDLAGVQVGEKLLPADSATGFRFGRALDLEGEELYVGAPRALAAGLVTDGNFGAVYRFDAQRQEMQKIGAFSESSGVFAQQLAFGSSLAVARRSLVIGAPETLSNRGAAAFQPGDPSETLFSDSFECRRLLGCD